MKARITGYSSVENWFNAIRVKRNKTPLPLATTITSRIIGSNVSFLSKTPSAQALGIKIMVDKYDLPIAVGYMDLSCEAEAFGAKVVFSDSEIPTIVGAIVSDEEEAKALEIPEVGTARTKNYLKGIEMALTVIDDRPVFAECIGPFSLAGRLVDVNEALILPYEEPEMMHIVLEKATTFLIEYVKAYKELGAHGILIAEPLAGILSPSLVKEFSCDYVKQIVDACQDKDFLVFYHNCGDNASLQYKEIFEMGCKGYHFGDKVDLEQLLANAPEGVVVLGNISPSNEFLNGTPHSMRSAVYDLMHKCTKYESFWLSSGCDVPANTDQVQFDEFFSAARDFWYCNDILDELFERFEREEE